MIAESLPGLAVAKLGAINTRQLVVVQTLDIARLTSHAVRLIPETFIAVTGMGPVDSNESGKTSFLAAVALLLGDPEWRVAGNGAAGVASLLFEPITAGIATGESAATEGYIAGVFADPDRISESAHTVWMKISPSAPFVQVRHAPGIHLARGLDDNERHSAAAGVFKSLSNETLGGGEFAEMLYGRSPRVLAYVASRGRLRSRPSLLKLDAGTFTPEQIGESLIALTGRATLFERDEEDRRDLSRKQADLAKHRERDRENTARELEILRQVEARERVRTLTRTSADLSNASVARAVVDTHVRALSATQLHAKESGRRNELADSVNKLVARRRQLGNLKRLQENLRKADEKFQKAEAAYKQSLLAEGQLAQREIDLNERLDEARRAANGYNLATEPSAAAAAFNRNELLETVGETKGTLKATKQTLDDARQSRAQAELGQFGESGEVIRRLKRKDIDATSLAAAIGLLPSHRLPWEARLAPWQDGILIAREDVAAALPLLHDRPGTILISEPDEFTYNEDTSILDLPEGIAFAPREAVQFLRTLSSQCAVKDPTIHVNDERAGIRIVGGFETPIVGRDDLLAFWDQRVKDDARRHLECQRALELAIKQAELAKINADRAEAAEEQAQLAIKVELAQQQLATHRTDIAPALKRSHDDSQEAALAAQTAVKDYTETIREIDRSTLAAEKELREVDAVLAKYKAASRPEDALLAAWGRGLDAALRALDWPALEPDAEYDSLVEQAAPPPPSVTSGNVERRSASTLQQAANDKLIEAVAGFRAHPDAGAAAPPEVADAVSNYLSARASIEGSFHDQLISTLAILTAWLEDSAEQDASAYDTVKQAQAQRAQATAFAEAKCREREQALMVTQGAIVQRASSALDRISEALDTLNRRAPNGLGAKLDYSVVPPGGPNEKWICQVTPRWRRNPSGPMLAYDNVTNTAQEKLFSIHLVLAALLAAPNPQGRVLILDELADSLGAEHRREVLDAIANVAREHRITILATCQDAIMAEASPHCKEVLYFHYPSKSHALNRPTRMFGVDALGERVELTTDALTEGRNLLY